MNNNEDYIRRLAHQNWIDDGCPDGEKYLPTPFGMMKIKDIHWLAAKNKIDMVSEEDNFIFASSGFRFNGAEWVEKDLLVVNAELI